MITVTLLLYSSFLTPLTSAQSGDETITVNHVVLVDTPPHPEWSWNYSYQTEVNDLQMDVDYIAVILIKRVGDDEWGGLDWWWDDIEGDGDQYNYTFSLQQGCYYINAALYEANDLNADEENAEVWAFDHLDFTVGNTDCEPEPEVDSNYDECLIFLNVTHDYDYSEPIQYSFNITADLSNSCAEPVNYPSTLLLNDTAGVETSPDYHNWRYAIEAGGSYPVSWQVNWSVFIPVGTIVNFEMHPTRDNCLENCSQSQNYSRTLSLALGPIDVNACYGVSNIIHDYDAALNLSSFNLSAELANDCPAGDIHYPQAMLYNDTVGVTSNPPEGSAAIGQSAYMIYSNTSTFTNWQILLDANITNGTTVTFSVQPSCAWYTASYFTQSNYMQDCDITPLDLVDLTIQIGIPDNQSTGNETVDNNTDDDEPTGNGTVENEIGGNETGNNTEDDEPAGNETGDDGTENDTQPTEDDQSEGLPSVGLFGTIVAISVGFVSTTRRMRRESRHGPPEPVLKPT